jgi:hypothetical protein
MADQYCKVTDRFGSEKAKRDEAKTVHAKEKAEKAAKKIAPEVPAKQ